ncbi:hypothetical protein D3C72_112310 [compost metagenome]
MMKRMGALTPAQCRAARALLDWTQQELADSAQLARATIRDFELGKHDAHRSTERLICEALFEAGVTLANDPILGEGVYLRDCKQGPSANAETPSASPEPTRAPDGSLKT